MKRLILGLLLGALLVLTACSTARITSLDPISEAAATFVPGVDTAYPAAKDDTPLRTQSDSVLYFRFGTEAALAAQYRTVTRTPSQTYEAALISQLLQGPSGGSDLLSGLFPDGTRVLSTITQGRTLFVTFSAELMNGYPDEPVDWQEHDDWREECPLRRRLCMQSLIATVTENCDVDQVQVLVQQSSSARASLRLKQNYFLDDSEDQVVTGPMTRDDSLLLGPDHTLGLILKAWSGRNWEQLYQWIAPRNPDSGAVRASLHDFTAVMEQTPFISQTVVGCVTLSADRQCATAAVSFTVLGSDGQTSVMPARIVRVYNVDGLWLTTVDQLTGWLEVSE